MNTAAKMGLSALVSGLFLASCGEADDVGDHRPMISPDGTEVVFMSSRTGDWELYLMNIDGSGVRQLTDHPGWDGYAVWAPDGTGFIFDREANGVKAAYKYDLIRDEAVPFIAIEGAWPAVNSWSPSGNTLVLFVDRDNSRDLYFADADGTNIRVLMETPDENEHDAHFSPDGVNLAYAVDLGDAGARLDVLNLQTDDLFNFVESTGYLYGLAWSPDGTKIAYTDTRDGDQELFILDFGTGEIDQLTDNQDVDHMPVWMPDGEALLFTSYRSGREEMYILDLATGEVIPFDTGL